MNTPDGDPVPALNIAAVERETRIGKDTLRVWERRYGFPQPQRDGNGERLYPLAQVERLRVVKRLLDAGHRPGRVVPLELAALQRLGQLAAEDAAGPQEAGAAMAAAEPDGMAALLDIIRSHDPTRLRRALAQALLRKGLGRFVVETALPLAQEIGRAWAGGRLAVFEEHLGSDALATALRAALAGAPEATMGSRPRVLLSTLQGEAHGLGLLMADALFTVEGCVCMNLGCQTPAQDLADAARAFAADIVAISASSASTAAQVGTALTSLRALVPAEVQVWAGTPHATLHRRGLPGVVMLGRLEDIAAQVALWRQGTAPLGEDAAP